MTSAWDAETTLLVKFLVEKSKNVLQPLSIFELSREFSDLNPEIRTQSSVRRSILTIRDAIHKMDSVDLMARDEVLFALGPPPKKSKRDLVHTSWSDEEQNALVKFIADQYSTDLRSISIAPLGREFSQTSGTHRSEQSVNQRIYGLRDGTHRVRNIDDDTKHRMMAVLSLATRKTYNPVCRNKAKPQKRQMYNSTSRYWDEGEMSDLMEFLGEKMKSSEPTPMDISQLAEEFKAKYASYRSAGCICLKIFEIRKTIHSLPDIDPETKKQMMLAFNSDPAMEIPDQRAEMLDFLAEISLNRNTVISDLDFLHDYMKGIQRESDLKKPFYIQYQAAKKQIPRCQKYSDMTKMCMMFVSSAQVDPLFLAKLRQSAIVRLNTYDQIAVCKSFDGNLYLNRSVTPMTGLSGIPLSNIVAPESSGYQSVKLPRIEEGTAIPIENRVNPEKL